MTIIYELDKPRELKLTLGAAIKAEAIASDRAGKPVAFSTLIMSGKISDVVLLIWCSIKDETLSVEDVIDLIETHSTVTDAADKMAKTIAEAKWITGTKSKKAKSPKHGK